METSPAGSISLPTIPQVVAPVAPIAPQPIAQLGQQAENNLQLFSSPGAVEGPSNFLESNGIVARIAFLLLVVIGFVILMRIGTSFLGWLFMPSSTPTLMSGIKDATKLLVIPQDPKASGAIPVVRSTNRSDGIELTWSIWININELTYHKAGEYKHIFHKGNAPSSSIPARDGMVQPNNAPGLYIHPTKNALVVVMNTFNNINEEVVIDDIPLNKWVNVVIRVEDRNLDVYINGIIAKRRQLGGVPKQNYGDVFVNLNGGFSGLVADLKYWNYAASPGEISAITSAGPDTTVKESRDGMPQYLSMRWYLDQN